MGRKGGDVFRNQPVCKANHQWKGHPEAERSRPYNQAAQIKKYLNWEDKSLFGF